MLFANKKIIVLSFFGVTLMFLLSIIVAPCFAKLFQCFYKIPTDPNATALLGSVNGAWGSYVGGLIGGAGTLLAVFLSINQTDKVQRDYKEENIRKEKLDFADKVIFLTAKYITEISSYYYRGIEERELYKELNKLRADNAGEERISQKRLEIKTLNVDRSKANECFFVLRMKLNRISQAQKLLCQIEAVHQNVSSERILIDQFSAEIKNLENAATEFAHNYTI